MGGAYGEWEGYRILLQYVNISTPFVPFPAWVCIAFGDLLCWIRFVFQWKSKLDI